MKSEKQFKVGRITNIIGYEAGLILIGFILILIWDKYFTMIDHTEKYLSAMDWFSMTALPILFSIFLIFMLIFGVINLWGNLIKKYTYGSYLNKLRDDNIKSIEKNSKDIDRLKNENEKIIEILKT